MEELRKESLQQEYVKTFGYVPAKSATTDERCIPPLIMSFMMSYFSTASVSSDLEVLYKCVIIMTVVTCSTSNIQ